MKFTAIILAGGQSRRMGANKAFMVFRGKPLIGYSLDLARELTNTILISADSFEMSRFGYPVIPDILPVRAPLAGIHAAMKVSRTEWNLVLTCDMPNVSNCLIEYLASGLEEGLRMVLPGHHGFVEPLCGFYHKDLAAKIEAAFLLKQYSPLELMQSVPHRVLPVDDVPGLNPEILFRNVNEPGDLEN